MNKDIRTSCRSLWQKLQFTYKRWLRLRDDPMHGRRLATRLKNYIRALWHRGWAVKRALVGSTLVLSLVPTTTTQGQTFTLQPSGSNPLDGLSLGTGPSTAFADLDGDGDFEAFVAKEDASILELFNVGDNNNPTFQAPPVRTITVPTYSPPPTGWYVAYTSTTLVDIDNDGDVDLFIAIEDGTIRYFRNDGDPSQAAFTYYGGTTNPFAGVDVGAKATLSLVDIDGDGLQDAFIGNAAGELRYYKNTGNSNQPQFSLQPPAGNPFSSIVGGGDYAPSFVDVDNDGDFDLFVGTGSDGFRFFENTTTGGTLTFVEKHGADNPLGQVPSTTGLSVSFVDIDGDNIVDAFVSKSSGEIDFYKGGAMLPVTWLDFQGSVTLEGYAELHWSTASESNNQGFEIQYAADGRHFEAIDFVEGQGTTSDVQDYTYTDPSSRKGLAYYRLKQLDFDGEASYSAVLALQFQDQAPQFSLTPNPATEWIEVPSLHGTLTLSTSMGKAVWVQRLTGTSTQIHIGHLAAGIYIASFQEVGTSKVYTQRLIIE